MESTRLQRSHVEVAYQVANRPIIFPGWPTDALFASKASGLLSQVGPVQYQ